MKEFNKLISVADRLMGEGGCDWDRKQTFESLRPYILEEASELLEAVDGGDDNEIIEELADLIYVCIFYCKVAEKENRFRLENVLETECEKLIRRHPHVFSSVEIRDEAHFYEIWEEIKEKEGKNKNRKTILDGIPKDLPLIARAQKVIGKLKQKEIYNGKPKKDLTEEQLGEELLELIERAEREGLYAESALRSALKKREAALL